MNVADAGAMRFDDQHRDHSNDRRIRFVDFADRGAVTDLQAKIDIFAELLFDDIGCLVCGAVVFNERLANFLWARANEFELALKEKTQAVDGLDIERIAHRDDQSGFAERDGDHFEASRILGTDLFDDRWRNYHGRQVDPIHVRLRRERTRDVGLSDYAVLNQKIARSVDLFA